MPRLEFTTNWNGKLFQDVFGTVRLHNAQKYFVNAEHELFLRQHHLGIVTVISIRPFQFDSIRDSLAYLDTGKPAQYLSGLLKKMYASIQNDTIFDHVIVQYKEKNIDVHRELLQTWWADQLEKYSSQTNQQPTLFD